MSQFTKLMLNELFEVIVQKKKVCLYQIKNTYLSHITRTKKKIVKSLGGAPH